MIPSHFVILLKGNLLQIYSGLEVIIFLWFHPVLYVWIFLESFSPRSVCLNFSGIVRIVWLGHVGIWLEFSVLVEFVFAYGLGSNLPCLLLLFRDLDRICRACFRFFFFSVDPAPFLLLFCLCLSVSSTLDSCCEGPGVGHFSSSDLSNVYWCGLGRSHMDD